MSVNVPAQSSPGAWSRGQRLTEGRASAHVTQPMIAFGGHAHDGPTAEGDGEHGHADVHARLDEHHQRLLNLEKGSGKT